jgi:hypothetical protein
MGLDITAHKRAELTPPHPHSDECYELGHEQAYVSDPRFRQSLRGLEEGRCYLVAGERINFRAGSYSGYNRAREAISRLALDVEPKTVWDNPDAYSEGPFFELVNFSDGEGTIGPEACADLAADFEQHRDRIAPLLDEDFGAGYYALWEQAFRLAAGSGLVDFH